MTRSLAASSQRFRALVLAIAVILMTVGATRLGNMPVDVFPEILPVKVVVQTEALGLSAAEVEQLITVPIEADLLAGTPWVDVMRSESVPGLSNIELTFKPGTDPMHARQVVQERLTQAHALPNVSKPPQMLQPLSSTNRVLLVGLSSEQQSLIEMSVLARWTIRPRLMGVPGVANVAIWGQRERQLQVQVDPEKLRANDLTLLDVIKTTGNALWYSPLTFLESSVAGTGGFIETPNQRLGVRHVLPIQVAADLAKVPVEGTNLQLGKVARVIEDHQPLIGDATGKNGPGLLLVIEKLPGANTLEVTDDIVHALNALKPGLGGIQFDTNIYNPANYIRESVRNVTLAVLAALVLIAVLLLALLYNWRAAVLAMITIPVALTTAVLILFWTGASMNVMLLAGLVVALGLIVDDAIASSESVLRRMRQGPGTSIPRALLDAVWQVRSPLVFATAVVLLAAVPLLFTTGSLGQFVKPMVVAYALAVLASLAVAGTVTPALSLVLFQKARILSHESPFSGWLKGRFGGMAPVASGVVLASAIVAAVALAVIVPRLQTPAAPHFKERDLQVHWEAMPGTSHSEMSRMIGRLGDEIRRIPGVRNVGGHVGRAILSDQVVGIHSSELWVSLDPKAEYDRTVSQVEQTVKSYPGVDADVMTYLRSRFGEALSGVDEPIVVRLYGQQQALLDQQADKVREAIAGIDGIVDPRIEFQSTEPVVEIEVNLEAAQAAGVKPGDVRRAAATLLAGIEVGNLFEEQKIFEVVVWGEPHLRHSLAAIENLRIDGPAGRLVRLGDVAAVRVVPAASVINRENVARSLDVVANVKGRSVAAVASEVEHRLKDMSFPLEYRAEMVGDFARQQMAKTRILLVSLAVAVGILFVIHAAFGSWSMALAVLTTLPIALLGSVIVAAAAGGAVSLGALAGILTVLGIAVRHAIVLIHRCRDLRAERGMEFGPELVALGTRERIGPFLMTAAVTAAAMLPFALSVTRPGHEILGPMSLVILGGLVTATLYAIYIVPALYARFGAGVKAETIDDELDLAV